MNGKWRVKPVNRWIALAALALVGCVGFFYAAGAEVDPSGRVLYAQAQAGDKPLRLHVLAHSDRAGDQKVKLEIRDQVLALLGEELRACQDKEEALALTLASLDRVEAVCADYLARRGFDYGVEARLERADFPEVAYGDQVYAAGEYDALRVLLGEAEGHNWWCVLFPPLCFVDLATEEDPLQPVMSGDGQGSGYRVGWKLWETAGKSD